MSSSSDDSGSEVSIDELINEANRLIETGTRTRLIIHPKRREDRRGLTYQYVDLELTPIQQPIALDDHDNDVVCVGTIPSEVINLCTPSRENRPRKRRNDTKEVEKSSVKHASNMKKKNEENGSSSNAVLSPEKGKCSICLESALDNSPTSTICGHVYCYECIVTAIRTTKKCPLCSKRLYLKNIHPIYL